MTKMQTLRPGLLVSLKTSVRGNLRYEKRMIEAAHVTKDGTQKAKWETERTVMDPVENEAARIARSKASTAIRRVCAHSAFGLLCPEADAENLEAAMVEAREIVEAFNATATLSRLSVYVITGRIAPDDVEAVKAINSEVRDLIEEMETGLKNLDVSVVRDAANRARNLGNMLAPEAAGRVQVAIETARTAARQIVKAGEQAAAEVDKATLRRLTEMRTSFLDLDEAKEVAAPKAQGRAVDLAPEDKPMRKAYGRVPGPQFELD